MKFRALLGPLVAILMPYLLFLTLRMNATIDPKYTTPSGHFYIVSIVALLALIIAIAVGYVGVRQRNLQVCFLSLAYISLAEIFAVHGLSTPGFILHENHLSSVAAQLSILLASFWLWMSSLPTDHYLVNTLSRFRTSIVSVYAIGLAVFAMIGLAFPNIVHITPINQDPLRQGVTLIVVLLNGTSIYKYYQSYRYSRLPLQISIVYSSGWMIVAQFIMITGNSWHLSWWMYHFLLLGSMIVMLIGLVKQYATVKSLSKVLHALFTNDPVERVTSSISPSVKALVLATETRDKYTAGHNFRVTLYALKLAEEMGLGPDELRALAQGTIVHDVGKIKIEDSILKKSGKLTEEERSIIQTHPMKGYNMCKGLGFMKEELEIIRHHHEKWDGTGYPDKLRGEEIPLLARIVAVADVYDALTSNRSYRKAWTHCEAMSLLLDQKGSHFDPVCVEAWQRICERDPEVYRYPASMITDEQSFPDWYSLGVKSTG
jgi:putative nucleotidyltransferase with HDIG domain